MEWFKKPNKCILRVIFIRVNRAYKQVRNSFTSRRLWSLLLLSPKLWVKMWENLVYNTSNVCTVMGKEKKCFSSFCQRHWVQIIIIKKQKTPCNYQIQINVLEHIWQEDDIFLSLILKQWKVCPSLSILL